MRRLLTVAAIGLLALSLVTIGSNNRPVEASSHREAPSTSVDPMVDNTDVYAFVDPTDPTRVNILANYIPFQLAQGGPNFYRFDDNVLYAINIDNNGDATPDIQIQWRFRTLVANPNTFLYNTGQVTSLNDPDLNIKQFYSVTVLRGTASETITPATPAAGSPAGFPFQTPPVNVGVRSTPNYETALAQPAIGTASTSRGNVNLFAGQRDEGFYIDIGSIFDLLGLRPFNTNHILPRPTAPGVDGTAGVNVSTLAIQMPAAAVTANGANPTGPTDANAVIGIWATASRQSMIVFGNPTTANPGGDRSGNVTFSGSFVQVSRLGNPLINELIVPLRLKDRFNASQPSDDAQFLSLVQDPEPARLITQLYNVFTPSPPRNDIVQIFLTGIGGLNQPGNGPTTNVPGVGSVKVVPSEQLRLNLGIPPSGPANGAGTPDRLGLLSPVTKPGCPFGDCAGFPNGRRVGDDVVDIELRALAGATPFTPTFNNSPRNLLGDGVNENDRPFLTRFPYLATPWAGYDSPGARTAEVDTNAPPNVQPEPTPRP
jgi:hypothetical protein